VGITIALSVSYIVVLCIKGRIFARPSTEDPEWLQCIKNPETVEKPLPPGVVRRSDGNLKHPDVTFVNVETHMALMGYLECGWDEGEVWEIYERWQRNAYWDIEDPTVEQVMHNPVMLSIEDDGMNED
jgi:hypothetical protein